MRQHSREQKVKRKIPHFPEHRVEVEGGFLGEECYRRTFCRTSILQSYHRLIHPIYQSMIKERTIN